MLMPIVNLELPCSSSHLGRACQNLTASHLSTHILKARQLTVAGASSFIIIVSVGFLILVITCVGSSTYYRRQLTRRGWPERWDAVVEPQEVSEPPSRPELWDVSVAKDKNLMVGGVSRGDWVDILVSFCNALHRIPSDS